MVGIATFYVLYMVATSQENLQTTAASVKAKVNYYEPLPQLNKIYNKTDRIVNPYNFSFILNAEPCAADVELVIIVHSSPKVSGMKS